MPPKSKLGKALNSFTNEYEYLIGYLKDPILEIDNGIVERAIRKFTIGRNNWMLSDTEAGANASSIFYSLMDRLLNNHQMLIYRACEFLNDSIRVCQDLDLASIAANSLRQYLKRN